MVHEKRVHEKCFVKKYGFLTYKYVWETICIRMRVPPTKNYFYIPQMCSVVVKLIKLYAWKVLVVWKTILIYCLCGYNRGANNLKKVTKI